MLRSGRTPLLRAGKLEKVLDVGEIYIKLEGQNPSGHKMDRVAEALIKDALARKLNKVLIDGSQPYIQSMVYYASIEGMHCEIAWFKNERWKQMRFKTVPLKDLRKAEGTSRRNILIRAAEESGAYLAAEGYTHTHNSQMMLESMGDERVARLNGQVNTMFTQLGHGYTVTGIYNDLLKKWMRGEVPIFPAIFCGASEKRDFLTYEAEIRDTFSRESSGETAYGHLLQNHELHERALTALKESHGAIVRVRSEQLKEAAKLLRKSEHIRVSDHEAYAFAAFYRMAGEGKLEKGRHVIILNEGKSALQVDRIFDFQSLSKRDLIDMTRRWLAEYSDTVLETADAIGNAMERGYILLASRNGVPVGICIVVNIGFKDFIPTYHLAYIGTEKSSKGRGVGSELIRRAIELTGGNLSLHVDLGNKSAKKVYEKYGFKHMYNRMIYYGDSEQRPQLKK
ncbi:MAG: hypothetical protein PWQ12_193 [Clostridiales bacterium]|nr:hypothetical protein [Clostridiales bacterium]